MEFSRKFLEQSEKRTLVSLVNLVNFYFSSQSQQLTSHKHLQFKVGPVVADILTVVSFISGLIVALSAARVRFPSSTHYAISTARVYFYKFIKNPTETDLPWSKYYLSTANTKT